MKIIKLFIGLIFFALLFFIPAVCRAMPPGTLLYRTSGDGKMYGYSRDPLLETDKGILKNIYAGHAALYIGRENGEDYIVEAMGSGIVKTPAKYFVNSANHEVFLGAKLPTQASELQIAKVVALAKSLVGKNLAYDQDFTKQKGPGSGEWTCVGLTEKLYESANIANPNNLGALEYDPDYYAVDITPDGYDNYSVVNSSGDCFSSAKEYSKIAVRRDLIIPAPELLGYDVGLEHNGERYIFLPYTQFLQPSLSPVKLDINVASAFNDTTIRGPLNVAALMLRWSLINNPLSAVKNVFSSVSGLVAGFASKTVEVAKSIGAQLFGSGSGTAVVLADSNLNTDSVSNPTLGNTKAAAPKATAAKKSSAAKSGTTGPASVTDNLPRVIVNKASGQIALSPSKIAAGGAASPSKTSSSNDAANNGAVNTTSVKNTASTNKSSAPSKVSTSSVKSSSSVNSYYAPVLTNTSASPGGSGSSGNGGSANSAVNNWPKLALINKIYATGNNNWLELINPTDHDFDLAAAGYRVEKTKTALDPALIMRIGDPDDGTYPGGTIIKAHDTYLIVASGANDYYRSRADALATRDDFTWNASGYTIYLGVAAITSNTDPDIVDAVGYGADVTYFQGAAPAPEITTEHILSRVTSSGNNQADFALIISDDPGIATSSSDTASSTDESTSTSSDSTVATSSDSTVATSSDSTVATSSDDISLASTTEEIATSSDISVATSSTEATSSVTLAPEILINKIYATGENDWLELFNFGDQDFDLAAGAYRLEKTMTASDPSLIMRFGDLTDGSYPGGTVIKAHDNYLIVRDKAGNYYRSQADALAIRDEFTWTGSGYTMYLGSGPISENNDPNIADAVGFGTDAAYFRGARPAVAISDNYILNRVATSSDNFLDFNLLLSDDPSIDLNPSSDSKLDLFVPPVPINSSGLTDLWHFDECYGTGSWVIGRWDCGRRLGQNYESVAFPLSSPADLNSFSASFNYQKNGDSPRVNFQLSSSLNTDKLTLILESGMITVEGLPNSQWRYYVNVPWDEAWHVATLVVDQAHDYWSIYIDGHELIRETFMARFLPMTDLELSGNMGPALVDEVAIWNRPLAPEEIKANIASAAPFNPIISRSPQLAAQLLHAWSFEEDTGIETDDSVGNLTLAVPAEAWVGRAHNNYALTIAPNKQILADLPQSIVSPDLSLGFWWRNSSYPDSGRVNIELLGGPDKSARLFSLLTDYYRLSYWFNNSYGVLAEGVNQHIPYDDAWHYLTLVYDSYRYKLAFYVDGEEKASSSVIWMKPEEAISRLKIMTDAYGSEIDDLKIWSGALSHTQIKDLYNNSK